MASSLRRDIPAANVVVKALRSDARVVAPINKPDRGRCADLGGFRFKHTFVIVEREEASRIGEPRRRRWEFLVDRFLV